MGFAFSISSEKRLVRMTGTGAIDFDESLGAGRALVDHASFESDYAVLVDLCDIDFLPSPAEIEEFGRSLAQFKSRFSGRIAVLVRGSLMFGLARMTCLVARAHGFPMRPFAEPEAADAWLAEAPD